MIISGSATPGDAPSRSDGQSTLENWTRVLTESGMLYINILLQQTARYQVDQGFIMLNPPCC